MSKPWEKYGGTIVEVGGVPIECNDCPCPEAVGETWCDGKCVGGSAPASYDAEISGASTIGGCDPDDVDNWNTTTWNVPSELDPVDSPTDDCSWIISDLEMPCDANNDWQITIEFPGSPGVLAVRVTFRRAGVPEIDLHLSFYKDDYEEPFDCSLFENIPFESSAGMPADFSTATIDLTGAA